LSARARFKSTYTFPLYKFYFQLTRHRLSVLSLLFSYSLFGRYFLVLFNACLVRHQFVHFSLFLINWVSVKATPYTPSILKTANRDSDCTNEVFLECIFLLGGIRMVIQSIYTTFVQFSSNSLVLDLGASPRSILQADVSLELRKPQIIRRSLHPLLLTIIVLG
jgi:hypothetical protein